MATKWYPAVYKLVDTRIRDRQIPVGTKTYVRRSDENKFVVYNGGYGTGEVMDKAEFQKRFRITSREAVANSQAINDRLSYEFSR